jgi:DNA-directed RNA polymerase subunit RPC12/RpoP
MNYVTHYTSLIERAKLRKLDCYKESHHIVPKSLGGTNDPSNLVDLTAREHYIAHILLAKIHGGTLWHAVNLMGRLKKYSNRCYEKARIEHSKLLSEQNRRTKTKPKENRHYKCSNCGTDLVYNEFCHHPSKEHYYCNATCRNQYIAKVRPSQIGRTHNRTAQAWNKGLPNPTSANNARKGAAKLSDKVKGRTRLYREDGSWTWQYP